MHVTGCVNIYLDMCVSLLVIVCVLCIFVSVYGIVSVLSKTMLSVENFSKFDALLHKTQQGAAGAKISRLDKFRSIILSKIIQIWRDCTVSHRNEV